MADLPQKCKKNYKSLEKLSDPESMSNHKRTVAASTPQPPVDVKEEHDDSYTPYNAELQLGLHSELDIKFEPDEQLQGLEEGEHDENTGYASTIKPEIEEETSLSAETQPIVFKKMNTSASSSSSKCKSEDCKEETEDNLIVTFKDLLDGENQENIEQGHKYHSGNSNKDEFIKLQVKGHSTVGKYICDVCSYITTKKQYIICHLKKHMSEKSYDCHICEKKFKLSSNLNRHIRTHTGYKTYACKFDKTFTQSQNFKNHVRTHTGEKSCACTICDKTYTKQTSLARHIRTHTGERPYACIICDKKFIELGCLKKHTRTHTGEKPYACKTCDRKFTEVGRLQKHTRTHTGEKPYACKICDRKFTVTSSLISPQII